MDHGPEQSIANALMNFQQRVVLACTNDELESILNQAVAEVIELVKWGERLLAEKDVVVLYPFLTVHALRGRRVRGEPPTYYKFGDQRMSPICYKVADIEAWIKESQIGL